MNRRLPYLLIAISAGMIILSGTFLIAETASAQNDQVESAPAQAQSKLEPGELQPDEFFRARVLNVAETQNVNSFFQTVEAEIISGPRQGERLTLEHGGTLTIREDERVAVGDEIVIIAIHTLDGETEHFIADKYRLPALAWIIAIFLVFVIFFSRLRGLGALIGLGVSVLIIVQFILPRILDGQQPLLTTLLGIAIILPVSIFLAHGFNRRTGVALLAASITIGLAAAISVLFVDLSRLSGLGTEEAFFLQVGQYGEIDFRGLLLAGILIGVLGVLDDITTAQTAVVDELSRANPALSPKELYARGLSVGREHIASLVNTLVLAYAGAGLPLLLLFTVNPQTPLWVHLNSNFLSEEIIRTIVGSLALVFAVPIATWLASRLLKRNSAA